MATFTILIFYFFKDSFIYSVLLLPTCMLASQKRAPDLITDGCGTPCGCWELNPGLLEKQSVLFFFFFFFFGLFFFLFLVKMRIV